MYRSKITYTFPIQSDIDESVHPTIVMIKNLVLPFADHIKSATIQKADQQYGISISLIESFEITNLYNQIKDMITVFAFKLDDIQFLTTQHRLMHNYHIPYAKSIDSFSQTYPKITTQVHSIVISWIKNIDAMHYLGIGGESCYYGLCNKYESITNLTNSVHIHNDNIFNSDKTPNVSNHLVDYSKIQIKDFILGNTILLSNISKKGLRWLATQINDISHIRHIVHIGCMDKCVLQDLNKLNRYKIIDKCIVENVQLHLLENLNS